jgi:hypothetical protein
MDGASLASVEPHRSARASECCSRPATANCRPAQPYNAHLQPVRRLSTLSRSARRQGSTGEDAACVRVCCNVRTPVCCKWITNRNHGADLLQKYVGQLECALESTGQELRELKRDKSRLECLVKRQEVERWKPPRFGDLFDGREFWNIPVKLRAIVEDNRIHRHQARKLRERCTQVQLQTTQLITENAKLACRLKVARQQHVKCALPVTHNPETQARYEQQADWIVCLAIVHVLQREAFFAGAHEANIRAAEAGAAVAEEEWDSAAQDRGRHTPGDTGCHRSKEGSKEAATGG